MNIMIVLVEEDSEEEDIVELVPQLPARTMGTGIYTGTDTDTGILLYNMGNGGVSDC